MRRWGVLAALYTVIVPAAVWAQADVSATADAIASGDRSHKRVEPSMSDSRNVTVPVGSWNRPAPPDGPHGSPHIKGFPKSTTMPTYAHHRDHTSPEWHISEPTSGRSTTAHDDA